jgi:hypothetical protein
VTRPYRFLFLDLLLTENQPADIIVLSLYGGKINEWTSFSISISSYVHFSAQLSVFGIKRAIGPFPKVVAGCGFSPFCPICSVLLHLFLFFFLCDIVNSHMEYGFSNISELPL